MSSKPPKPITGQPLVEGYDAQLHGYVEHLEAQEKADILKLLAGLKEVAGGMGGKSEYEGPFAVIAGSTAGSVTICGANSDAGRPTPATVTLGTTVSTFAEASLAVSATGYVYLEITYSSSYAITAKSGASMTQDDTHYCVPLAYVVLKDGKISSIQQLQFGQVEGAGRIF
jgi:hypothetical protein